MKRCNHKNCTRRKRLKGLIAFVIACSVLLLVLEVLCRLLPTDFSKMRSGQFSEDYPIDPLLTAGVFLLDEHTFWRFAAPIKEMGINEGGFRATNATALAKSRSRYRIMCIGDSVTFGVPQTLNRPEDTYPKRLEAMLHDYGLTCVEVLNAGVPGYTSYQGLQQLRHRLIQYDPDCVIVQFGINDGNDAVGKTDAQQGRPDAAVARLRNVMSRSAFCCTLAGILSRMLDSARKEYGYIQRVPPNDFARNYEDMRALGARYGFSLLFIRPVLFENGKLMTNERHQPPRDALVVDMFNSFRNSGVEATFLFHDNCHLTHEGHDLLAATVFDILLGSNLIHKMVCSQSGGSVSTDRVRFGVQRTK